jgi:hypothetical protein
MHEQGFAYELRGAETLTLEQAREAGRMAARKWATSKPYKHADAYDALSLYVVGEHAKGMARHSTLADAFCDAYDEEIERLSRDA